MIVKSWKNLKDVKLSKTPFCRVYKLEVCYDYIFSMMLLFITSNYGLRDTVRILMIQREVQKIKINLSIEGTFWATSSGK